MLNNSEDACNIQVVSEGKRKILRDGTGDNFKQEI